MATIDRRGATVSAADPPIGTNPNPDLAIKAPVRLATTGSNITLSGLQTIDGVALAAGDRVLVKDQTDATTNGLYNASTGNWTRTIDANNNSQFAQGMQVVATAGTANAGTNFQLTAASPIVVGTSHLTFVNLPASYVAPFAGAISRTLNAKLADFVSVEDFRVAGETDDTAAIQRALNASAAVYLPGPTYTISSPGLTISNPNAQVFGAGMFATTINYVGTTGAAVTVTGTNAQLSNFSVTRSGGTPVAGATGINAGANLAYPILQNLYVTGHFDGVVLGSSARGAAINIFSEKNFEHGFVLNNSIGSQTNQWDLFWPLSQKNDGRGYVVTSNSTDSQLILGTWFHPTSFANTSGGILIQGSSGHPVNDAWIIHPVLSTDGADELSFNSFGRNNFVIGGLIELAGTGLTGHAMSTAASNVGNGLIANANEVGWLNVIGGVYDSNSFAGIASVAAGILLSGVTSTNNGQSGLNRNGFSTTQSAIINGGEFKNTGGGAAQAFGIFASDGSKVIVSGANLTPNATAATGATTNLAQMKTVACNGQADQLPTAVSFGANGGTGASLKLNGATSGAGTITAVATGGGLQISSGSSVGVVDLTLQDTVAGDTVRESISNLSTANNSTAGVILSTGVANSSALFQLSNNSGTPGAVLFWGSGVGAGLQFLNNGTLAAAINNGLQVGAAPTGGDKGAGTINVSSGIFLNNTSYTNPDYVLEYAFTGKIEKFADRKRAKTYAAPLSLPDLREHIKKTLRLPGISDEPADIFERADIALEKVEELTIYILGLHERIAALEARLAQECSDRPCGPDDPRSKVEPCPGAFALNPPS
jgi:hypothetical protein